MKTKHILLGLSLGLLGGFTACDVTDLDPKDSITDNSYWNTVSDLENYAKGFCEFYRIFNSGIVFTKPLWYNN